MALELILVRHAKSSWDTPGLTDHDRPLNQRGRTSAQALGRWLKTERTLPQQVLCSSAVRTRETYERMKIPVAAEYTRELYHAGIFQMLEVLRQADAKTVMMLGHNPGIGEFAERLVRMLPKHGRFLDYPTGATTVIRFDADNWADVDFGTGEVENFVIPRELIE